MVIRAPGGSTARVPLQCDSAGRGLNGFLGDNLSVPDLIYKWRSEAASRDALTGACCNCRAHSHVLRAPLGMQTLTMLLALKFIAWLVEIGGLLSLHK